MPAKQPLKIHFFGDIVGKPGRRAVVVALPQLKQELQPDLTIANGENLAHGLGITAKTLNQLTAAGVDLVTSGNHIWEKPEIYELFKNPDTPVIRPANYPDDSPGQGYKSLVLGEKTVLVLNLHGQVFINDEFSSPFEKFDEILKKFEGQPLAAVIVDFHAEATSEKVAFGWHCAGRASAVLGTHTHVPTADDRILPGGTAYITDVGMAGLKDSVIGINRDVVLYNFTHEKGLPHDIAESGVCTINAVYLEIDPSTKEATTFRRIHEEITI